MFKPNKNKVFITLPNKLDDQSDFFSKISNCGELFHSSQTNNKFLDQIKSDCLVPNHKMKYSHVNSKLFAYDRSLENNITCTDEKRKFKKKLKKLEILCSVSPNKKYSHLINFQTSNSTSRNISKNAYLRSLNMDFSNPIRIINS